MFFFVSRSFFVFFDDALQPEVLRTGEAATTVWADYSGLALVLISRTPFPLRSWLNNMCWFLSMNFNSATDHATITTNSRKRVNLSTVPLPKLLGWLLGGEGPPLTARKLSFGSVPAREATSHTLPSKCVITLLAAGSTRCFQQLCLPLCRFFLPKAPRQRDCRCFCEVVPMLQSGIKHCVSMGVDVVHSWWA